MQVPYDMGLLRAVVRNLRGLDGNSMGRLFVTSASSSWPVLKQREQPHDQDTVKGILHWQVG